MNKRLILLVLLALSLRIFFLGAESLWLDEGIGLYQANSPIPELISEIQEDVHVPGYTLMLHAWLSVFPDSEFSIRMPSVLFSVASLLLIYFIGRKLFDERIAFVASFIFAVSPIAIFYAQEARVYSMLSFFILLSTYFFLRFLDGKKYSLFYLSLTNVIILYSHLFGALFILMQSLYILFIQRFSRNWFFAQFLTGLLFIPWLPTLLKQIFYSRNINWIDLLNMYSFIHYSYEFFGSIIIVVIFLATFNFNKNVKSFLIFFIIPFFIISLAGFFIPLFHVRYLLFTLPFFLLVFAKQLSHIPKVFTYIVLIILLILSVQQAVTLQKDDWRSISNDIIEFNGTVLVHPYYHQEVLSYYIDKNCFYGDDVYGCMTRQHNIISLNDNESSCHKDAVVSNYWPLNFYTPIMLVNIRSHIYFDNNCSDFFNESYDLLNKNIYGEITVYEYIK